MLALPPPFPRLLEAVLGLVLALVRVLVLVLVLVLVPGRRPSRCSRHACRLTALRQSVLARLLIG